MKKLVSASLMAVTFCATGMMADDLTGYISDAHCGAKHDKVSAANTKCIVDMCIKGGSDPVLVKDGKVMKFDAASREKAVAHAGENVKIDGTVEDGTVKINSIDKAS